MPSCSSSSASTDEPSAKRTKRVHAPSSSTTLPPLPSLSSESSSSIENDNPPSVNNGANNLLPTPESTPPGATKLAEGDKLEDQQQQALSSDEEQVRAPRANPSPKDRFVAGLVGASVIAIESIWGSHPLASSSSSTTSSSSSSSVLPLHWFVKEVLRRSRTSCSTLQVALYYLHRARRDIRAQVARRPSSSQSQSLDADGYPSPPATPVEGSEQQTTTSDEVVVSPVLCGRRMFLASLICASKYLQDKNYSNRAWAKISGLATKEITDNERVFLHLLDYRLHLGADDFDRWTDRLASLATQAAGLARSSTASSYPSPPNEILHDIAAAPPTSSTLKRAATESSVIVRPRLKIATIVDERPIAQLPSRKRQLQQQQQHATVVAAH
ncbi:hypothetical protein RQP46_006152 [Phenoliferia psychrophenolica]